MSHASSPVTAIERRAIMKAAHRTRKALSCSMGHALKAAWAQFRRNRAYRWPTNHLIMPFEREVRPRPYSDRRPTMTRDSGRLAWSFAA